MAAASASFDTLAARIPVTIVTGFLGAGKTTLIRRLLTHPDMNRVAVIVNEFGEVGIDQALLESAVVSSSADNLALLSNGCLCCAVRTDLEETLRELVIKRRRGEVIDFDRVLIETSGMADPVPVLHSLGTDAVLLQQYRVDGVATLVDAVNGAGQLDAFEEAVKQVAVADRIVLTKTDLAPAEAVAALRERIASLNASASILTAVDGELAPEALLGATPGSVRATADALSRWLDVRPERASGGGDAGYLGKRLATGSTHRGIDTFTLWFDAPFAWDAFASGLHLLASLRGPDLLRVKGLVNVAGEPGPVLVQGAQHLFHPPVTLERWTTADRRSRLVFITRGIKRESVERLLGSVAELDAGGG
jgi:G3E family GTPase